MALFIPGGPAGGAPSGSIGSMVFSHNRYGAYMRTRVIPTNPATAGQVAARNRLSSLTNAWLNVLTQPQRDAWTTYAANVPVTNRIGQQIFLTGLNWYVACNALRLLEPALSDVNDAPSIFNLSTFDISDPPACTEATQLVSFTFDDSLDWADDDGALFCFVTRPQNASIEFNNLPYRFAGTVLGDTAIPPTSPGSVTVPFPVVEGQKLFVRFNCVQADGRIGAEQKYSLIVAA